MTHWQTRAACAGHPEPDIFTNGNRVAEAQLVCAACPVIAQCRDAGVGTSIGTWGGVFHKSKTAGSLTAVHLEEHGTLLAYKRHLTRGEKPCGRCTTAHLFDWHKRQQTQPQKRTATGRRP